MGPRSLAVCLRFHCENTVPRHAVQWHSDAVMRRVLRHRGDCPALVLVGAALGLVLWAVEFGHAQPTATPAAEPTATLEWIAGLTSPPAEVPRKRLLELLQAGQRDAITDAALSALSGSDDPGAVEVIHAHTRHRRPETRLAAYGAIARMRVPDANPWLAEGLRDRDALVRGLCATALGERGAQTQAQWLLRALERGVQEAAAAVGAVAPESALPRVHALLGRAELAPLLAGYGAWLMRRDVSVAAKLDILARLEEVAGPEVAAFLKGLLGEAGLPRGRVRTTAQQVLQRVSAGIAAPAGASRGATP